MFHRLPGEYVEQIGAFFETFAAAHIPFFVGVTGIRHLGAGVAFIIESAQLDDIHACLRSRFTRWLGGQDLRKWQPHITVQNKVSRKQADALHRSLSYDFAPTRIQVIGIELWRYVDGPWEHERSAMFHAGYSGQASVRDGN
jgi:hypothetical protein